MFIPTLKRKLGLTAGSKTEEYCLKIDKKAKSRYEKTPTVDHKAHRLVKKQEKAELRHLREKAEGVSYKSNMTLIDRSANSKMNAILIANFDDGGDPDIVFFDTETTGLWGLADIIRY